MIPYTYRAKCRQCETRQDCRQVGRKAGGAYNRAHRWYNSPICEACALRLLERGRHPGARTIDQWSGLDLERAWGQRSKDDS